MAGPSTLASIEPPMRISQSRVSRWTTRMAKSVVKAAAPTIVCQPRAIAGGAKRSGGIARSDRLGLVKLTLRQVGPDLVQGVDAELVRGIASGQRLTRTKTKRISALGGLPS